MIKLITLPLSFMPIPVSGITDLLTDLGAEIIGDARDALEEVPESVESPNIEIAIGEINLTYCCRKQGAEANRRWKTWQ